MRLDLILTMRNIYINSNLNLLIKFTSSSRSSEFKDILPRNISQMTTKTIPISMRMPQAMWSNGTSCFEFIGKSMETETIKWSEFPYGGKVIVEQILAPEEINKSKRAGLWEPQSGSWVGKLTFWVRSFEIKKNSNRVHQVYQFHQNMQTRPYDGC